MWVISPLVIRPGPHFGTHALPSTLKVLRVKEHIPTPFSSIVFTFKLAFESYEEFGGASLALINFLFFEKAYFLFDDTLV